MDFKVVYNDCLIFLKQAWFEWIVGVIVSDRSKKGVDQVFWSLYLDMQGEDGAAKRIQLLFVNCPGSINLSRAGEGELKDQRSLMLLSNLLASFTSTCSRTDTQG